MTQTTLGLHFGAMAASIKEQTEQQNILVDSDSLEHYQKDADAITRLHIRGLIAPSVCGEARKKLVNKIAKEASKLNGDN